MSEEISYLSFEQILFCKFPPFDSKWSKEEMCAWFDAFQILLRFNGKECDDRF